MLKKYPAKVVVAEIGNTDGKAPEWVLLFKAGWGELDDGTRFFVDRKAFDLFMARLEKRGVDVVWDYEHATISNAKAPAAGWSKEYRWTDGLGIEVRVDWTEEAAAYIAKKEYRYFSPVFAVRKSDKRVVWLHSVALTNSPKTNNLTPLLAKLGAENQHGQEDSMNFLEELIAKLGLDADADEAQVLVAVDGLNQKQVVAKAEIPPDVLTALKLEKGDVSTVVASIHALNQTSKTMVSKADFEALKTTLADRDAAEAVDAALQDGKITPDQKDWAVAYAKNDLEGFLVFVTKAPVIVPVRGLPGQKEKAGGKQTPETLQIAKMFGNSEEDLKKYGGVEQD